MCLGNLLSVVWKCDLGYNSVGKIIDCWQKPFELYNHSQYSLFNQCDALGNDHTMVVFANKKRKQAKLINHWRLGIGMWKKLIGILCNSVSDVIDKHEPRRLMKMWKLHCPSMGMSNWRYLHGWAQDWSLHTWYLWFLHFLNNGFLPYLWSFWHLNLLGAGSLRWNLYSTKTTCSKWLI